MEKITNKQFTEDEHFKDCCINAAVEPTMRQASKFRNKKGLAYKNRIFYIQKVKETVPYIPATPKNNLLRIN